MKPILLFLWLLAQTGFASAKDAFVDMTFVGDVMVAEKPGEIIESGGDPLAGVAKHLGPSMSSEIQYRCEKRP